MFYFDFSKLPNKLPLSPTCDIFSQKETTDHTNSSIGLNSKECYLLQST